MTKDFTDLTELPGRLAAREQQARLYHRYCTAGRYVAGKRVLEVACGAGFRLGYLARTAKNVVWGDYTEDLVRIAQSHYEGRVALLRLDAHHLPFCDEAFDFLVIHEAIYYFAHVEQFIAESRRVLSSGGKLLICTVNKDWSEFAASPHSTRYLSVSELRDSLTQQGFHDLEFFGALPTMATSPRQRAVSLIRRVVVALHLMPKTLEGRARFKGIFYGKLTPLKPKIADGMAELCPLVPISRCEPNKDCKILYAVGSVA